MSEPATEAGRRLLDRYANEWPEDFSMNEDNILAIEQEARVAGYEEAMELLRDALFLGEGRHRPPTVGGRPASPLAAVARDNFDARAHERADLAAAIVAAVEGLEMGKGTMTTDGTTTTYIGDIWGYRAAVLDAIREASER